MTGKDKLLDQETLDNMEKLRKLQQVNDDEPPKTNKELFSILKQAGIDKRKEKEYISEKGVNAGKTIRPRLTFERYAVLKTIGEDERELETSPLYWYEPDTGTYTKNVKKINAMINIIDNQATDRIIKEVRNKLILECKEAIKTNDTNLVIVNNGIYDRSQNKLLPFTMVGQFLNGLMKSQRENRTKLNYYGKLSRLVLILIRRMKLLSF